ncbi:MAG: hypothetical protein M3Z96_06715 [Pseudomonadota bacterium]|nr:hypothetical protein [Pseudomonadota bacterium]
MLDAARRAARALSRPSETKPPNPEIVKPESKPPESEQPPIVDANKLHHIFEKQGRDLESLISDFGSQEAAFEAIENATREVVRTKEISGKYEIQITVGQHKLTVRGNVMPDGTVKIGTVFP